MELAIQLASNDKIRQKITSFGKKTHSLLTQAKRGEKFEATFPAIEKRFDLIYWEMELWNYLLNKKPQKLKKVEMMIESQKKSSEDVKKTDDPKKANFLVRVMKKHF